MKFEGSFLVRNAWRKVTGRTNCGSSDTAFANKDANSLLPGPLR